MKKKQELLVQARSQAGAWERENNNARLPFSLPSKKLSNCKLTKGDLGVVMRSLRLCGGLFNY